MLQKIVNTYLSKLKGEDYKVGAVPSGYLFRLVLARVGMKIRGRLLFPGRRNVPFVARGVTLRVKSKIVMGQGISIGRGSHIDALSREGIRLGNNTSIGAHTKIECTGNLRHLGKGLIAGDNAGLGSDNFYGCAGGITIGKDTIVGNFVSFHAENHNYSREDIPIRLQGVTHKGIRIGDNCWIGAKSTILDGVVLEDGCVIAAGALVKDGVYKKNGIYGGVPARFIKSRVSE